MSYPVKYTRQFDFFGYQNATPNRPLPGDKVNADLNAVVTSIGEIVDFLKLHARSDGALLNGSVTVDSLSPEVALALGFTDAVNASSIAFTPTGGIAATNVQSAIAELDTEKAAATHTHAAADITSGTMADARIAASNVTQHAAAVAALLDTDDIANVSDIAGATITAALDAIAGELEALGTAGVSSVFGRSGAVVATAGDYAATQVSNDSGVAGATVAAALDALDAAISGAGAVASVFGRSGAVVATAGDYAATQVSNDSGVAGATVAAALDALDAAISGAGAVASVFGRTGAVVAASSDYDAVQVDFTPAGNIAATNVQAAIQELDSEKLASSSYTAADVLSKLLTVDGSGSGLDADLLDGLSSTAFARVSRLQINVLEYGAVGDGLTSDQMAVVAAVAAAYSAGAELYWPPGTYLTSANITNLHDVKHRGPGVVKRGANLFYVDPRDTQTNTLFVATTGSATNDGLSTSEPMTLVRSAAVLLNYADKGLAGRWVVQGAAGTYTEKFNLDSMTWSDYPISLKGPDVSHPTTPTMILDLAADTSGRGVSIADGGWLMVEDVKVIGATGGYGFYVQKARLTLTNCHVDNCLFGVVSQHGAQVDILGGDYDGNDVVGGTGYFGRYGSSHTIGNSDTPSDAALFHNWGTGLRVGEGTFGHLDGTRVHDCTTGVRFDRTSNGCNTKNMQIYRNGVGILAETAAWFNNNIDFGSGGNANTVNVRLLGGPEYDFVVDNAVKTMRLAALLSPLSHTGTTAETTIWNLSGIIRNWMVSEGGHVAKIELSCEASLTANLTLSLYINNGGADDFFTAVTVPSGTTDFKYEATIHFTGAAAQRAQCRVIHNGMGADAVDYGEGVVDLKNAAGTLKLTAILGSSGNSVTFRMGEFWTTLGG